MQVRQSYRFRYLPLNNSCRRTSTCIYFGSQMYTFPRCLAVTLVFVFGLSVSAFAQESETVFPTIILEKIETPVITPPAEFLYSIDQGSDNPLERTWRSENGEHALFGELVSLEEDYCRIRSAVREHRVKITELCELDQLIIESLFGIDLKDTYKVREFFLEFSSVDQADLSLVRSTLYESKIDYLHKHAYEFKTEKAGCSYVTTNIVSISPASVIVKDLFGEKKFPLSELSSNSKKLFVYCRQDAEDFLAELSKLESKRRQARRSYSQSHRSTSHSSTPLGQTGRSHNSFESQLNTSTTKFSSQSFGHVWVRGHYKNGTWVAGHFRTHPNDNFYDNWSTIGNVNPYTGKRGTKKPKQASTRSKAYMNAKKSNVRRSTYTPRYYTPRSYFPTSRTIHVGPRGGRYYINGNGNKTYVK